MTLRTLTSAALKRARNQFGLGVPLPVARSTAHQRIPRATQGRLQTLDGREQDVQFAGLNLLDRARVDLHQFGELFLGEAARDAFPAHIRAERGKLGQFGTALRHALLGRGFLLPNTAQWGVIC